MNSASQSLIVPTELRHAADALAFVNTTRLAAARSAAAVWFPLLVGGIATVAAPGAIGRIPGDAAPAWYWAFAGPSIGIACAIFYATRRIQLRARLGPLSVALAVAMITGALTLAGITGGRWQDGAPVLVVAAGLAAFALLYRSTLVGIVAGAHIIAAVIVVVADSPRIEDATTIGTGLVSCACGIAGVLMLDPVPPTEP